MQAMQILHGVLRVPAAVVVLIRTLSLWFKTKNKLFQTCLRYAYKICFSKL